MAPYATATKQHAKPAPHSAPALQGGRPLQTRTRTQMNARFGHDFSSVRIHADSSAARLARSAGAKALTLGNHILFGSGRYTPGSQDSDRLLTHELAHVVQQEKSGPGDPTRASRREDPSEREAEKAEDLAAAGSRVQISAAPDAAVARDEDNTCTTNDDDGGGFFDNPYWKAITDNSVSGASSMLEVGAEYKDTKNQLAQSEDFRDMEERNAWLETEKQAAAKQASSQSSSPAEPPWGESDVNPSYNAMEPENQAIDSSVGDADAVGAGADSVANAGAGGQPNFKFDTKLSSGGYAGSQAAERTGVYQESLPGVSDPVAVKVMPADQGAYFENELDAAQAGQRTGYGPQVYGEQPIPDVGGQARRGFAMEKVEGGFPEAAGGATEAETAEAAKWAGEVTPQTVEDVQNFHDAMIGEGFAPSGDLQGFVTPGGRWRPIDYGGYTNLNDPALGPQGLDDALDMSTSAVRSEQNMLRPHMFNNMINSELQGVPPDPGATPLDPAEFEPGQNASQLPPESQAISSSIDDELRGTPPEQSTPLNPDDFPASPMTPEQQAINSNINEELGGTGGRAPVDTPGSEPLNPSEFGDTGNVVTGTEEAIQGASMWGKLAQGMHYLNYGLNPLGMVSNSYSMYQDIKQGRWGHAALDAGGLASSTIGTAAMIPGVAGELGTLGPAGAVIGAGVGGYALGEMSLNQANKYAAKHNIFGDHRDSTEAAGDAGIAVRDYLHSTWVPNVVGDIAGGAAAIGSSWGTAAYSGVHALGSGIGSGASWLWDHTFGSDDEEVDQDALNKMSEQMGQNLDEQDAAETDRELEENMSYSSSAHEEMPPLPTEEQKK